MHPAETRVIFLNREQAEQLVDTVQQQLQAESVETFALFTTDDDTAADFFDNFNENLKLPPDDRPPGPVPDGGYTGNVWVMGLGISAQEALEMFGLMADGEVPEGG